MSKISRRKFISSSAAAVGTGLIAGAALTGNLPFSSQAIKSAGKQAAHDPLKKFDSSTNFSHWSFGGIENSNLFSAKSSDFKYWFDPVLEKKSYSFRNEVLNACKKIDEKRAGKTIALCFSGGVDSEIIAVALDQLKIPYEMYFLDMFGLNKEIYRFWVKPFAKARNKEVQVVSLSKEYFMEDYSRRAFLEYGCELPTYLAMTHLFSRIPENQFIVVGDGDLDRQGDLYSKIGKNYPASDKGWFLAYSTSSVLYSLWAQKNQREGSYYFFSSTPELLGSVITDPSFGVKYPFGYTRDVIKHSFPEVPRREKSTNWEGENAQKLNAQIRRDLRGFAAPASDIILSELAHEDFPFWKPGIGTVVDLNGIFRTNA